MRHRCRWTNCHCCRRHRGHDDNRGDNCCDGNRCWRTQTQNWTGAAVGEHLRWRVVRPPEAVLRRCGSSPGDGSRGCLVRVHECRGDLGGHAPSIAVVLAPGRSASDRARDTHHRAHRSPHSHLVDSDCTHHDRGSLQKRTKQASNTVDGQIGVGITASMDSHLVVEQFPDGDVLLPGDME